MESDKRKWLALLTLATVLVILAFLWIINKGQPIEMQGLLNKTLVILSVFAVIALMLFIFFGEIFNEDGSMQKSQITIMLTAVICIIQITLSFATYSFKQLEFENKSLQKSKGIFQTVKPEMLRNSSELEKLQLCEEISSIYVLDKENIVTASNEKDKIGKNIVVDPLKAYRFPSGDFTVVMYISKEYQNKMVKKIVLDLLSVLVSSIILTIELVIFSIKFIESKFDAKREEKEGEDLKIVGYVRQIAFFFYFSSRMATTFITIIAKELGGNFFGFTGNVLAGIPQAAEFLLTCVAIFVTSIIIEKKGWKLSFVGGLCIVAVGTLLSAFSVNIAMFILSRAVVGLGYGFCWMTLRNFALFAPNAEEKTICFAMLNAGIYAGINCGAVLGSILADILGYKLVLLIAAVLTMLCTIAVFGLENATYKKPVLNLQEESKSIETKYQFFDVINVILFVILMIVPSCIVGSYMGYYLPIYFTDIGKTTSDIGRSQLIYGLIIVYIGPFIVRFLNKYPSLFKWNMLYNIIFSAALIIFGLKGGFIPAMLVVIVIGFSDSFGFVAQNNYFLNLQIVKKLGESRSLSYVSTIKKLAEMLGPIAFGLTFMAGNFIGIAIMGGIFLISAAFYAVLIKSKKFFELRESV